MTRTAVVTGGMSGLGAATATRLTADGVKVLRFDLAEGAEYTVDVADSRAVNTAAADVGPVDILINCAGIVGPNKPLWEISDAEWDAVFSINVRGTFNLCRAFVPGMR